MFCDCESRYKYHDFVECITTALDARDPYTGNHSNRVSEMACRICRLMSLTEQQTQEIHLAAHLHDIGKIGIPDGILLKEGALNKSEWELMKTHPVIGATILNKSERLSRVAAIIIHHHERFDGTGYPFGAKDDELPVGSKIISICDSIDAMASNRSYRKALPLDVCRNEIENNIGKMYDPVIARLVLDNWDYITEIY